MRTKNGKWIGPVPIALVAVFALAAFISAGFWLIPSGAQAQGLPALSGNDSDTKCEIVVAIHGDNANTLGDPPADASLKDGGCNFSGSEAVVTFVNQDRDSKAYVVAYATGGNQFAQMQATDKDGNSLGAEGIDEYLIEVPSSTSGAGGIPSHGKETITVSRSMQKSGEVYVFAYVTNAATKTFNDGQMATEFHDIGVPLSLLVSTSSSAGKRKFDGIALGNTIRALEAAAEAVESTGLAVVFNPGMPDATPTIPAAVIPPGLNLDSEVARVDELIPETGEMSEAQARTMEFLLTTDSNYSGVDPIDTVETTNVPDAADDRDGGFLAVVEKYIADMAAVDTTGAVGVTDAKDAFAEDLAEAMTAIAAAKATLAAVGDRNPQNFTNSTADVAVLVKFQDPAVEKVDGEIASKVTPDPVNTQGESPVTVEIRDKNGAGLNGFVTLTIAADAGADVVFKESKLKTHRVPVKAGGIDPESSATIEGLPKRGPVRIMVTADFNGGELMLEAHAMRRGNPESVSAMTYACVLNDDAESQEDVDNICVEEAELKTSKLDEATVFGPGEQFLVVGTVKDAAGNGLDDALSASEKRAAGVTSITVTFSTKDMVKMESRIIGEVDEDGDAGSYEIDVEDGSAKTTISIIVSNVASMISVSCDPEIIPTDSGLTECTVMVTDDLGNIPSNLGEARNTEKQLIEDTVRVAVRSEGVDIIGVNATNDTTINDEGMASFSVLLSEEAVEGSITVFVSSIIGGENLRVSTVVMYGDAPSEPGMPMNVMAMATSHDMITVSWDAVMDATSYMVERGYMDADNMMMWMTVAEMTTDMMYMDSGLMAETTYYYRVAAMNSSGMGDYSDMVMAMTMAEGMPTDGDMLTSPSGVDAASLPGTGTVSVSWTPGQNATQHWVVLFSLPGYDAEGRVEVLNDPDANFQVLRNVPAGEYEVVVASYDPDMGFQYQDGIGMVTVE